jgi:hypothetical protein
LTKKPTLDGVMKKITLSFDVLAAIIAVTMLQACASPAVTPATQCKTPTLNPEKGERSGGEPHQGHDSDGDAGGYIVLHPRRF